MAPVCRYDPANNETPEGIVPGDPGFATAIQKYPGGPASAFNPDASRPFPRLPSPPNPAHPEGAVVGRGAYVDLGALAGDPISYAASAIGLNGDDDDGDMVADDPDELANNPHFLGAMTAMSYLYVGAVPVNGNFVYDPWTIGYERDGFNQDRDVAVDEGHDGLDNDALDERETSPPYPHPLKSLQVRIRVYEGDTRQVRQVSQAVKFGE
jgi:hypothetical protein